MIDLHTHSTCSDGTLSPAQLVRAARKAGVTHMALTDHDTVAGLAEAREEAGRQGVAFMGGMEISAEYQPGTMHILGYGFDESSPSFLKSSRLSSRLGATETPRLSPSSTVSD